MSDHELRIPTKKLSRSAGRFPAETRSAAAVQPVGHHDLQTLMGAEALRSVFQRRLSTSEVRGIDRLSAKSFAEHLDDHIGVVQTKCGLGTYRFTPYREVLKVKGPNKNPRVLSVPTIRDRLVLTILKDLLHEAYPECVPRLLPNEYLQRVVECYRSNADAFVLKADIRGFYDSIDQARLLRILRARLPPVALTLVERAVRNPTVPRATGKSRLRRLGAGVPQGLSISNILAEIYLHEFDRSVQDPSLLYLRYVDDILMVVRTTEEARDRYASLERALHAIGLEASAEKRATGSITTEIDYLGYRLKLPVISVRASTIRRLEDGLARLFASYSHESDLRFQRKWLDRAAHRRILVDELNERITGALSENRRYGWLFYFSEMTDMHLLYRLDHTVRCLWERYVRDEPPEDLKRFVRAFHEVRHNQEGGYIHNYNRYQSLDEKLEFLVRRGHLDPNSEARLTQSDIEELFARVRAQALAQLDADVGTVS